MVEGENHVQGTLERSSRTTLGGGLWGGVEIHVSIVLFRSFCTVQYNTGLRKRLYSQKDVIFVQFCTVNLPELEGRNLLISLRFYVR